MKINEFRQFYKRISYFILNEDFQRLKKYCHHINSNRYAHIIRTTYLCYKVGLKLKVNLDDLLLGSLLHDYYFYDNKKSFIHLLKHPKISLANVKKKYQTNKKVDNMILSHMFPLTFYYFPKSKEAIILVIVDKVSALMDFFK